MCIRDSVHTYPDGDRDFSFYRNPGADMMLTKDEIQEDLIRESRIFHFGTLSSTHEGVREATRYAIDVAKEAGCIVSFDPNLRPPLWKSLDDAKAEIEYGLGKCDILKSSDNEVEFLFGTTDYDKGAALLKEKYNIPLILITLGKDGSRAYYKDMKVEAAPFPVSYTHLYPGKPGKVLPPDLWLPLPVPDPCLPVLPSLPSEYKAHRIPYDLLTVSACQRAGSAYKRTPSAPYQG